MNPRLLIAGLLALFTAAVHLFIGTPEVHRPLLDSLLLPDLKLLLYACWHLVSVMLAVSGVFLLRACAASRKYHPRELVMMLGLCWVAFGLVFVAFGLIYPGMLLRLPQWILLLPVGTLCLWDAMSYSSLTPTGSSVETKQQET
jgi:H+/Cl- antiporter ClcA